MCIERFSLICVYYARFHFNSIMSRLPKTIFCNFIQILTCFYYVSSEVLETEAENCLKVADIFETNHLLKKIRI